ncbi:cupin domain-containing protein [Phenylobacterium sp. LjRoot225]|uniref:cupin domain-containing protein n=1 Tax=Phenylobacterium sp. LjRoot225 TaxID=3342285 RepID=UPI003ED0998A
MSADAAAMIASLDLAPHPEGGWYRETWRAEAVLPGGRAAASAILFLLEAGQRSHWHRVDAGELWLFQAGAPFELSVAAPGEPPQTVVLGPAPHDGHTLQHLVPTGAWQSAQTGAGWTLVACVVAPGFEFAGFELAPPGWSP